MLKKLTDLRKKYALSTTVTLSAEEGAKIKELPELPDGITYRFDSTTKHMEYKKSSPCWITRRAYGVSSIRTA